MHAGDGGVSAVMFLVSCDEAVQQDFNAAVAAMHNMTYNVARGQFKAILEQDPDCGMAHWGVGMTYIHPLWSDSPNEESMVDGASRVAAARATELTPREAAYVDALAAYYDNPDIELYERLKLLAEGIAVVLEAYPGDLEAKAFFAVTHLSTAAPGSIDIDVINRAATAALEVLAEEPNHPGAHHYIIHAFDYPELAERAVEVANAYAKLSPDNPHSLHMPTHIFTRLGMWEESIALNTRSAEAALAQPFGDAVSVHYPHALDYLLYAYIQTGQDSKARVTVEDLNALRMPIQVHPASAYHLAAAGARSTLERHDWEAAAATTPRSPSDFPWDDYPQFEALAHFGVALGAARSGKLKAATNAIFRLQALEDSTDHPYWKNQVKVMRLASQAWLAEAAGNRAEAVNLMTESAELEAGMSKHPITPGEILPSGELLGDMMMLHGNYSEALVAYQSALTRNRNRFNSLYGAGLASEELGDADLAREYYQQLLDLCDDADIDRDELAHAKVFVVS